MVQFKLTADAEIVKTKVPKYYRIQVKHSDCGHYELLDTNHNIIEEVEGYAPDTAIGSGDYTELMVDNDTGIIVGWVPIKTLKDE